MKNIYIGLFVILWASISPNTLASMAELEVLLAKFSSFEGDFSQKSFDQNGQALQQLQGNMKLKKPDHFYWQSEDPNPQQLISNGITIWHYDADLEQVVIQEYSKQAKQAPILVILKDSQSLKASFTWVSKKTSKGVTVYSLQAIDKQSALKKVDIGFSEGLLKRLEFVDSLQQKTHIEFSNMQINRNIEASLFEFILPEGIDVLYE